MPGRRGRHPAGGRLRRRSRRRHPVLSTGLGRPSSAPPAPRTARSRASSHQPGFLAHPLGLRARWRKDRSPAPGSAPPLRRGRRRGPRTAISSRSLCVELDFLVRSTGGLGHEAQARAARRSRPAGPRPRPRSSARSRRCSRPVRDRPPRRRARARPRLRAVDRDQRRSAAPAPRAPPRSPRSTIGFGSDLPRVDRAREFGRAHSAIVPASSAFAVELRQPVRECRAAARASAAVPRSSRHRRHCAPAPPRAAPRRRSPAPRATRRAGRRAPHISLPTCLPTTTSPTPVSRSWPSMSATNSSVSSTDSRRQHPSRSIRSSTSASTAAIMSNRPGHGVGHAVVAVQAPARATARPRGATAAAAPRAGRAADLNRRESSDIGDRPFSGYSMRAGRTRHCAGGAPPVRLAPDIGAKAEKSRNGRDGLRMRCSAGSRRRCWLAGCSSIVGHKGYLADEVAAAVGPARRRQPPFGRSARSASRASSSQFGEPVWYYVSSTTGQRPFSQPADHRPRTGARGAFDAAGNVIAAERTRAWSRSRGSIPTATRRRRSAASAASSRTCSAISARSARPGRRRGRAAAQAADPSSS